MKNLAFFPAELDVLLNPEKWQVIASFLPQSRHSNSGQDDWSKAHTETHPFREMLFVLSGRGTRAFCGKTYTVRPGTIMLTDVMEPHDGGYPVDYPSSRHIVFSFVYDRCTATMASAGGVCTAAGYTHVWHRVYPMMSLGLASSDAFFPEPKTSAPVRVVRQRCFNALRLLVSGIVEKSYSPDVLEYQDGLQEVTILEVMKYIQESHGRNCQLDHLAHMAGYSRFHFCRLFQKYANISIREFVNETRKHSLQQMLKEGRQLKTISRDLGFSHQSAFYRWRQQNGV